MSVCVGEAIIGLKEIKITYQSDSENFRSGKINILQMKECSVQLSNPDRSERLQKTTKVQNYFNS